MPSPLTLADCIDATYQEHAEILRAVMQRKTEQAQLLLKSHVEQSKIEVRNISLHALHLAKLRRRASG
jgi:DNA-binding GntR family transcriptional regulator